MLNLHPQSLRILKSSDLMPYVVFVAPPSIQQLKRWKMENLEQVDDDELEEIIERAREMEERSVLVKLIFHTRLCGTSRGPIGGVTSKAFYLYSEAG